LAKEIKEKYPTKDIWLYTGYTWEKISNLEVVNYIDVMVDGPFEKNLKDNQLHWKGSSNQRVIDVPATLKSGEIVLFKD
jgi:anaerobic ribonucleoside-triphosphate reductase activating protein